MISYDQVRLYMPMVILAQLLRMSTSEAGQRRASQADCKTNSTRFLASLSMSVHTSEEDFKQDLTIEMADLH